MLSLHFRQKEYLHLVVGVELVVRYTEEVGRLYSRGRKGECANGASSGLGSTLHMIVRDWKVHVK